MFGVHGVGGHGVGGRGAGGGSASHLSTRSPLGLPPGRPGTIRPAHSGTGNLISLGFRSYLILPVFSDVIHSYLILCLICKIFLIIYNLIMR